MLAPASLASLPLASCTSRTSNWASCTYVVNDIASSNVSMPPPPRSNLTSSRSSSTSRHEKETLSIRHVAPNDHSNSGYHSRGPPSESGECEIFFVPWYDFEGLGEHNAVVGLPRCPVTPLGVQPCGCYKLGGCYQFWGALPEYGLLQLCKSCGFCQVSKRSGLARSCKHNILYPRWEDTFASSKTQQVRSPKNTLWAFTCKSKS
jgi:hypothetical protein